MGKIKNWKRVRSSPYETLYKNTLPMYSGFHNQFIISIHPIGRTKAWGYQITKNEKGTFNGPFFTKKEAFDSAIKYMRENHG